MEDTRKREWYDTSDTADVKRSRAEKEEEMSEDVMAWLSTDEDTMSQLMELLEDTEKSCSLTTTKVRFISNPYSSPLIFQSWSSSYVTINGNDESCGSSYSDSDSSVMASVDMGGIVAINGRKVVEAFGQWSTGAWGSSGEVASDSVEVSGEGDIMDGCDVFDWDDELLARFLGEDL